MTNMLKIAVFDRNGNMQYVRAPFEDKTTGDVAIHVMSPDQLKDLAEAIQLALLRLPSGSFTEQPMFTKGHFRQ
jgi:hypothetical protein